MWSQVKAAPSGPMDGRLSCGCRLVHSSRVISTVRLSLGGSTAVPSSSAEQTSPKRCQASSARSMREHEAIPVSGGASFRHTRAAQFCAHQRPTALRTCGSVLVAPEKASVVLPRRRWSLSLHSCHPFPYTWPPSSESRCKQKRQYNRCASIPWLQRGRGLVVSKHPKPWMEIEELKNHIEQHGPKICTEELRRQTRHENEKERKRGWRGSEFRREARVSSAFFFGGGGFGRLCLGYLCTYRPTHKAHKAPG